MVSCNINSYCSHIASQMALFEVHSWGMLIIRTDISKSCISFEFQSYAIERVPPDNMWELKMHWRCHWRCIFRRFAIWFIAGPILLNCWVCHYDFHPFFHIRIHSFALIERRNIRKSVSPSRNNFTDRQSCRRRWDWLCGAGIWTEPLWGVEFCTGCMFSLFASSMSNFSSYDCLLFKLLLFVVRSVFVSSVSFKIFPIWNWCKF